MGPPVVQWDLGSNFGSGTQSGACVIHSSFITQEVPRLERASLVQSKPLNSIISNNLILPIKYKVLRTSACRHPHDVSIQDKDRRLTQVRIGLPYNVSVFPNADVHAFRHVTSNT